MTLLASTTDQLNKTGTLSVMASSRPGILHQKAVFRGLGHRTLVFPILLPCHTTTAPRCGILDALLVITPQTVKTMYAFDGRWVMALEEANKMEPACNLGRKKSYEQMSTKHSLH